MNKKKIEQYLSTLKVAPDSKSFSLKKYDTDVTISSDELTKELLQKSIKDLSRTQDILYADKRYSVLIVLQGMDTAGKDGVIHHVMTGMNPEGITVSSFKVPSTEELSHDYFWRHYQCLPARGDIGIFNRSHYENVLVTKVHPELLLKENIPGIEDVKDISNKFWKQRYKQIKDFEENLTENGTIILKFFLHISKKEQKRRLLERIDDPAKNWKFSVNDIAERGFWSDYQEAYETALSETSTDKAPWFVIPADNKWFARLAVGTIIAEHIEKLKLEYPVLSKKQLAELEQVKTKLLNE